MKVFTGHTMYYNNYMTITITIATIFTNPMIAKVIPMTLATILMTLTTILNRVHA